jgi:hypothetical protein
VLKHSILIAAISCAGILQGCSNYQTGTFKGTFPVYFTGVAMDANTGEGITEFGVQIALYNKPLVSKTVKTDGLEYGFTFNAPVIDGRTYMREGKEVNVLGGPEDNIMLTFRAKGYKAQNISISKDMIAIGQVNIIDFELVPESKTP